MSISLALALAAAQTAPAVPYECVTAFGDVARKPETVCEITPLPNGERGVTYVINNPDGSGEGGKATLNANGTLKESSMYKLSSGPAPSPEIMRPACEKAFGEAALKEPNASCEYSRIGSGSIRLKLVTPKADGSTEQRFARLYDDGRLEVFSSSPAPALPLPAPNVPR